MADYYSAPVKRLPPIALAIASAMAASPLFLGPGFLNTRGGGDSPFLLFRLHQLCLALAQGVFPVRWMPDAAFGLGYPFFNYYAALPLYLAALFKLFGASYVLALKLTHLAGFALAAIAMYGWMRSVGANRLAAWLAAVAYTFAPFHLANVFVRGDSLNEFFAFALYPLCLWSAHSLSEGPSLRKALPLAVSYAALLFTHNISALIFSPFLGLYLVWLAFTATPSPPTPDGAARRPSPSAFMLCSAFAIALGLALSAFFWFPAIREADQGQLAPVTQGYFHYANHFRGRNLVQPSLIFNYDVGDPDTTPFAMGLAQAALTVLGLIALGTGLVRNIVRGRGLSSLILHPVWFLAAGLLASTFMITRFSEPLWASLPLLPFVQFPWRFLSVQSVFTSALIGWAVNSGPKDAGSDSMAYHSPLPASLSTSFTVLLSAICLLPSTLGLRPDFIPITDADITPERLQIYEYFTGNIGTTINYEYLPRWTQPRPYSSEEFIFGPDRVSLKVLGGQASGERTGKGAASQTWRIRVEGQAASLAVPLLYWPGWEAYADGRRLEVRPADGLGWVAFDLLQGEHTLELKLGQTAVRRNASLISALALFALIALAAPWKLARRAVSASPRALAGSIASVLIIVVVALAGHLLNAARKPIGAATMDFDQQGYLYASAVPFGNGDVLQGYNYSAETLEPGGLLGVALQWQAGNEAVFTLELVSPAEHLLKIPHTLAAASGAATGPAGVRLDIPHDMATGVYLLRLKLFQRDLLAPAFTSNVEPRGTLYLRPIRIIRPEPDQEATDSFNRDPIALTSSIRLLAVDTAQADSTAVNLTLHWQAAAPVPANHMLALRLNDSSGFEIAALDVQPTGGVYPTSAWRVGEVIPEFYRFDLPSGLPPGDYPLALTLYDAASLAPAGTATVPIHLSQWSPPPGTEPLHRFSDTLALHDAALPASARAGDRLAFTVRWTSLAVLPQDLSARWSAVSRNGEVVAVEDHPLAVIPSSQWVAGALVLGRPSIKLPIAADPGQYTINLQLLDPAGELLSPPVVVGALAVAASDRTSTVPPVQFESGTSVGPFTLVGYDAAVSTIPAPVLTLNLVWKAAGTTASDYKYFVHVFNPADESIAVQLDGFPRVPTSLWEQGEVVSLAVALPLDDLEPNTVYNIGVGWYAAATGDRLGERIILSQGIIKP